MYSKTTHVYTLKLSVSRKNFQYYNHLKISSNSLKSFLVNFYHLKKYLQKFSLLYTVRHAGSRIIRYENFTNEKTFKMAVRSNFNCYWLYVDGTCQNNSYAQPHGN